MCHDEIRSYKEICVLCSPSCIGLLKVVCTPLQEKVLVSVWSRRTDADMLAGVLDIPPTNLGFGPTPNPQLSVVVGNGFPEIASRKRLYRAASGRRHPPPSWAASLSHRPFGRPRQPFCGLSGPRELPPGRGPVSQLARRPQPHLAAVRESAGGRNNQLISSISAPPHSTPTCQPLWTSGCKDPLDPGSAALRLTRHSTTSASSARARIVCSG